MRIRQSGNALIRFDERGGIGIILTEADNPTEYAEVKAYLAAHPEALVPEPVPPPPTPEALAQQTIATNQAILTSTDWHFAYSAETGEAVLQSVLDQRKAARAAITAAKTVIAQN